MVQSKSLHHFVPRSYLRAFADEGGDLLAVLRKPYEVRRANIATAAAEHHFYKLRRADGELTDELEDALGNFDALIPKIVANATREQDVTDEDVTQLKRLYSVMVARGHIGRDLIVEEVQNAIERLEREFDAEFPDEDTSSRRHYVDLVVRHVYDHRSDLSADPHSMSRANVLRLADEIFSAMPRFACVVRSEAFDFITSDAPFSAFNAADPPKDEGRYGPDMSSPTVELTLPITRRHLVLFANRPLPKRAKCYDGVARIANGRTAYYAKRMVLAYPSNDAEANALVIAQLMTYRTSYLEPLLPGFDAM